MASDKASTASRGGLVETAVEDCVLLFGDGVRLRYLDSDAQKPQKHQLLLTFTDSSTLAAVIQMYGGVWCFPRGEFDNRYYQVALEKPAPLADAFDLPYFNRLFSDRSAGKLSAKAFLATEQRIPGLGNGVLQDILFTAKIHPKRKVADLSVPERKSFSAP